MLTNKINISGLKTLKRREINMLKNGLRTFAHLFSIQSTFAIVEIESRH